MDGQDLTLDAAFRCEVLWSLVERLWKADAQDQQVAAIVKKIEDSPGYEIRIFGEGRLLQNLSARRGPEWWSS